MPVLTVFPIETRTKRHGTLRDEVEYDIGVEIQISVKQYFDNAAGQGTQLDSLDALVALVEDRTSTGDLVTATVMGILNDNITISAKVLFCDNIRVRYEDYLVANKFPAVKATVTFTAYGRPNRLTT